MKTKQRAWWVLAGTVIVVTAFVWLAPVFGWVGHSVHGTPCLSNVKQYATAMLLYSEDHDGRMPIEGWIEVIEPYRSIRGKRAPDELQCPEVAHHGYAMNLQAVGVKVPVRARIVLVFETAALGQSVIMNLAGRVRDRHINSGGKRYSTVAYSDGSAKVIPEGQEPR